MKRLIRIGNSYPEFITVINILISIIIGILSDILLNLDNKDSFIMGVISMVALSLIQMSLYCLGLEDKIESLTERITDLTDLIISKHKEEKEMIQIDSMIKKHCNVPALREGIINIVNEADNTLQTLNNLENVYALDILYKEQINEILTLGKEKLQQLKAGVIRVYGNESSKLWENVIQKTEKKFFTTNLSMFQDNLMGAKTNKHLLDLQKKVVDKIGSKNFERVFLYNENVEKNALKNVLKLQSEIGITVSLLDYKHFNELSNSQNWIEQIGSADFTIIDDNFLCLTHFDNINKGKVLYVDMYRGGERLRAAINFADTIRRMALILELNELDKWLTEVSTC